MNSLSKKLFAWLLILGIISTYGIITNNRSNYVNGATVSPTPISEVTPTPTKRRPTPTPILFPTIPPDVNVTFNIAKVNDASEVGLKSGKFTLWSTQTGPTIVNGYYRVNYIISGTAINGVDYQARNLQPQYIRPLSTSILVKLGSGVPLPTGVEADNIYIQPLADNLIEGTETVTLTLTGVNVGQGSATVNIEDGPTVTPTPTRPVSTTATATPTSPPTVTPTPITPGNYVVTYTIQSDWGNGATIEVAIKNNTTIAVNGWTLAWTFPGAQTIVSLWSGTYTQSGASVSVKNAAHNAVLSAGGGSVNFGFNISYSGINAKPTSFTLNGTSCLIQ